MAGKYGDGSIVDIPVYPPATSEAFSAHGKLGDTSNKDVSPLTKKEKRQQEKRKEENEQPEESSNNNLHVLLQPLKRPINVLQDFGGVQVIYIYIYI